VDLGASDGCVTSDVEQIFDCEWNTSQRARIVTGDDPAVDCVRLRQSFVFQNHRETVQVAVLASDRFERSHRDLAG
jgi:hypothetical protein